ncbi:dihydrodiol dehydrogenase [Streptomyces sp. SHP 1-2]|uniref:dihydrodiol dehydrogenase n=1 Tax=Streptomyces sp. SHP 1-2 TaxID=2769489 RepID=UPI002237652F|nr:dihydrodiol dehydrogenase [Streptomyces sp. SHP 1-2]MCW5253192.1 dihydrodiol dehydrogenase [Streptomyces sp. SHP 1-2]
MAEPVITTISNEFAFVEVRRVDTRNGERLSIRSPKRGYEILLDAVLLEALSWTTTQDLTPLLETPHGPDAEGGA